MDGPLDLQSRYPEDSFVAVVAGADEAKAPHDRVLRLISDYCRLSGRTFGRTELGLGMSDFAAFPAAATSGLHLRSPVRGWHNNERVGVRDLVSHADLLAFLLLRLDNASLLSWGHFLFLLIRSKLPGVPGLWPVSPRPGGLAFRPIPRSFFVAA